MDNMLRRIVQNIQEKREKFWKEDCKTVVNFDGKRLLKKQRARAHHINMHNYKRYDMYNMYGMREKGIMKGTFTQQSAQNGNTKM